MKRHATANWKGSGKEGTGSLTTKTGILNSTPFSYHSRFVAEEQQAVTNPEELIAAAHAGCFSMKLSFVIGNAGFVPDEITTVATVTLEGGAITHIHLDLKACVPGMSQEQFLTAAEDAKANCPVSKALSAVEISMSAEML